MSLLSRYGAAKSKTARSRDRAVSAPRLREEGENGHKPDRLLFIRLRRLLQAEHDR